MSDSKSINPVPRNGDPFDNAVAMIETFIANLESRLEKARRDAEPKSEPIPADVPYFETW